MSRTANAYSRRWHETFHRDYDSEVTKRRQPSWRNGSPPVASSTCAAATDGTYEDYGSWGYDMVGVESDPVIAAEAGALCLDARELNPVPGEFDGVICMWASFGLFSRAENRRVLDAMKAKLRPGGRLVLDLQKREFFESRQGQRELRPGIRETSRIVNRRRRVLIEYGDGVEDEFDFEPLEPARTPHDSRLRRVARAEPEAARGEPCGSCAER